MGLFPEGEGVLHLCNLGTASDCERHGTGMSPNNQMLPIASRFRRYARTRDGLVRTNTLQQSGQESIPRSNGFSLPLLRKNRDTTLGETDPLGLMSHFAFQVRRSRRRED